MRPRNYGLITPDGEWIKVIVNDSSIPSSPILAFETEEEARQYAKERGLTTVLPGRIDS